MRVKTSRSTAGESLIESLVALLIVCLAIVGLTAAVLASVRVNDTLHNDDVGFDLTGVTPTTITVSIERAGATATTSNADLYKTSNGFYYYDYQTSH